MKVTFVLKVMKLKLRFKIMDQEVTKVKSDKKLLESR